MDRNPSGSSRNAAERLLPAFRTVGRSKGKGMTTEITVSLSGGGVRTIPAGSPARDALSGKVAGLALGVMVDGQPRDLATALVADCSVAPILADSAEGLDLLRHSSAHLLAHAVKRLFPEAQVTIGPVIENGFFYDFQFDRGFRPEDLERIEAEMAKIVAEDHEVRREDWTRDDAVALFLSMGEKFKAEIIRDLPDATVGLYRQGDFVDLCRGPHVPKTGRLGAFKLLNVAGAYWRGDEHNPMLQRVYGLLFPTPEELAAARDALTAWLAREGDTPDWPGIDVFTPALDYTARHPSIRLAFEAAAEAAFAARAETADA